MRLFTIFLFASSVIFAQIDASILTDTSHSSNSTNFSSQIRFGIQDLSDFFNKISEADNTDLVYTSLFAGGLAASFALDNEIRNTIQLNQNSATKNVTDIGERYGSPVYSLAISAGLFTTGLVFANEDLENTGRVLFEALLIAGGTAQVIKIISGRSRPFTNEGSSSFKFFELDNSHNSFPSGHTVVAFTTSAVLAGSIKNVYASIGLYSLAGLTAYQRIYSDNHWLSDTILAAALGTVIGNMLVMINDKRCEKVNGNNFSFNFSPVVTPSTIGLIFALKF